MLSNTFKTENAVVIYGKLGSNRLNNCLSYEWHNKCALVTAFSRAFQSLQDLMQKRNKDVQIISELHERRDMLENLSAK